MTTYSLDQIAEQFDVSPTTVSSWIRNKELRAFSASRDAHSSKRRWRVTEADLNEFIESRLATTSSCDTFA